MIEIIHQKLNRNIISSLCGGRGKCGKCRIKVMKSVDISINPPTEIEMQLINANLDNDIRLACQVIPQSDLEITIIDLSEEKDNIFKIQDTFSDFNLSYQFKPRIKSEYLNSSKLFNIQNYFQKKKMKFKAEVMSKLEKVIHENSDMIISVFDTQSSEVIAIFTQKTPILGTVIDIGTTSIVMSLIDLESGKIIDADSIVNPQIEFGRDIMSRLTYALKDSLNQDELQKKVLKGIAKLLTKLLNANNFSSKNIFEIVVVGNSVMHHLFLNLPIIGLSRSPFTPTMIESYSLKADELKNYELLKIASRTIITVPPLIGGFIGSDAVADILYTGFIEKQGIHILIDFGTNSEILLVKDKNIYAASVAAGGAFEGQHIECGMRGLPGAIEKFWIINGKFDYHVIQSIKPKGICGTGIVDILAQLLINNQLDRRGRLFDKNGNEVKKLTLIHPEDTLDHKEIYLTRLDVEAIQKAKAATMAAIRLLTSYLEIDIKKIDSIQIAGVFGSKINIKSAKTIGLLPNLPDERFVIQGNTAEKGGRTILLSLEALKTAKIISKSVKRLELTRFSQFQSVFTEELFFKT